MNVARSFALTAFAGLGLAAVQPASAQNVFFPNNATINDTVNGIAQVGYADQTDFNDSTNGTSPTINIVDGASLDGLRAYNSSIINAIGGDNFDTLLVEDSTTLSVSGSNLYGGVSASGVSKVMVTGGIIDSALEGNDNSTITVTNGSIDALGAQDSSSVFVSGGTIGTGGIGVYFSGNVMVSGGTIEGGLADNGGDASSVTIKGGTFGTVTATSVNFYDDATGAFTFIGTGLTYADIGANSRGGEDYAFTGGTLQDGNSLVGDVVQVTDGSMMFSVATPTATPEPSAIMSIALGVVGLGTLRLRARRRTSL